MEHRKSRNIILPVEVNTSDDIEELFSELAQQTDARTTGLQLLIEKQAKASEDREKRRWSWFTGLIISIAAALLILGFETWERHYDRLTSAEKQLIKIDEGLCNLKDIVLKKHELHDMMEQRDKDREQLILRAIDNLRKELKKGGGGAR